ncbi:MAG: response regulator transcription factor [Moraxellaceae bacterium]|nr:MAG: response regulator transcription factor [Moraxellaceae bacterium]
MMQQLFITHSEIESPRWRQAFPDAKIVMGKNASMPSPADCGLDNIDLPNSVVWFVLTHDDALQQLPIWLSAGARVVILTQDENPRQAKHILEMGANGYLHYLAAAPVLEQVNQVVQVGGLWLGADLMRQLVLATANILKPAAPSPAMNILTSRERDVAEAVAAGKTNKEVARDLDITERTVKAHLGAVFEKLNVRDRLQLVLVMSGK